jgi:hypothetical protein
MRLGHETDLSLRDGATNVPEDTFSHEPIAVVRTPFESPDGMPIRPIGADSVTGTVETEASYADGLADPGVPAAHARLELSDRPGLNISESKINRAGKVNGRRTR